MKIAILPLDSRPCSYDFPASLGRNCDVQIMRPPLCIMDHYDRPGQHEPSVQWLLEEATQADALILSMDQIIYGGIFAMRRSEMKIQEVRERMKILERLQQKRPGLPVYITHALQRTGTSTSKARERVWGDALTAYIQAAEGGEAPPAELAREVPGDILREHLSTRWRNHEANVLSVQAVVNGWAKELVLVQDSATPQGMHKAEQQKLLDAAQKGGVADRVHILAGTCESGAALMGMLIARLQGRMPKIHVAWLEPSCSGFRALHEDRAFAVNLREYMATCGVSSVPEQEADAVMLIHATHGEQRSHMADEALRTTIDEGDERRCEIIEKWLEKEKKVALLDVRYCNGGDPALLELMVKRGSLGGLAGYAGWNTAGNSLGCLLGQLCTLPVADAQGNARFTRERLLDDGLYQGAVRARFSKALKKKGEDIWHIQDVDAANELLQTLMDDAIIPGLTGSNTCEAKLRWPRIFEADIRLK